jgi:hypothetical protein
LFVARFKGEKMCYSNSWATVPAQLSWPIAFVPFLDSGLVVFLVPPPLQITQKAGERERRRAEREKRP